MAKANKVATLDGMIDKADAMAQVAPTERRNARPEPTPDDKPEAVDHPAHYNAGKIEVIDAIEDWKLGFHEGNVVKYIARHRHKNGLEDVKKAKWYIERLINRMEAEL